MLGQVLLERQYLRQLEEPQLVVIDHAAQLEENVVRLLIQKLVLGLAFLHFFGRVLS